MNDATYWISERRRVMWMPSPPFTLFEVIHGWRTVAVVSSVDAVRAVARLIGLNDPFDEPLGPVWVMGGPRPSEPQTNTVSYNPKPYRPIELP